MYNNLATCSDLTGHRLGIIRVHSFWRDCRYCLYCKYMPVVVSGVRVVPIFEWIRVELYLLQNR
jgi:hypothetical protein